MTTLPTAAMNGVDELFGPAPVLSTEDAGSFKLLFEKVAEALMPRDFIEMIYIRRFVCEVWLIERLGRHGTIAIERRYQESREQMLYNARVQKARKDKLDVVTFVNTTPRDIATLAAFAETPDEILTRRATETDHNRAMEKNIELSEALDSLMDNAIRRRNDAMKQLEVHRVGLGARVKEVADRIVDVEFREVTQSAQGRQC